MARSHEAFAKLAQLPAAFANWNGCPFPLRGPRKRNSPRHHLRRGLLDVRQDSEFAAGHFPGALHIELGSVADATTRFPAGPVATMCGRNLTVEYPGSDQ